MQRSRGWCFTINHHAEPDWKELEALQKDCQYLVAGREVGANGTPHIQGYVYFTNVKSFKQIKAYLTRAHIEKQRGTALEASTYCKKDGDFFEDGEHPGSVESGGEANKERWNAVKLAAKENRLEDIPSDVYVRYYGTLKKIAKDHMKRPHDLDNVCGHWYYGRAGTGKTTTARLEHPEAYIKSRDKWWDGYQDEGTVILDDIDKYHVALGGLLKDWADKWTFKAEEKGGYKWLRPTKFIVTSQYSIDDIWADEETREALHRRFKCRHFVNFPS